MILLLEFIVSYKMCKKSRQDLICLVNLLPSLDQVEANDPGLTEMERKAVQRGKERFQTPTTGAALLNSTRPATIGAVMSSSPLALLAW